MAEDTGQKTGHEAPLGFTLRHLLELAGGIGYALRDGAACRLRAAWTDSVSDIGRDYQRVVLALEVGCVF